MERVYRELHEGGQTWNQPLRWNLDAGGTYGWGCDRYMNSPAVWFVYLALAGVVLDRPAREIALRPRLLPETDTLDVPVFAPGNWGRLRVADTPDGRTLTLTFTQPEPVETLLVAAEAFPHVAVEGATLVSVSETAYGATREWRLSFPPGTTIGADGVQVHLTR